MRSAEQLRRADERANLGAGSAEDDGVDDVGGGAESEFDRDGVGLFTIDLLGIELAIRAEGVSDRIEEARTMTSVSSILPRYLYASGIVGCLVERSLVA